MDLWLGFLGGQILALAFQWTHWKAPGVPWSRYWRNGHVARHLSDLILALVVLMGWESGMLRALAGLFGADAAATIDKLPQLPEGKVGAAFVGFAMAFAVRKIHGWIAGRTGEPPAPPNSTAPVTP